MYKSIFSEADFLFTLAKSFYICEADVILGHTDGLSVKSQIRGRQNKLVLLWPLHDLQLKL